MTALRARWSAYIDQQHRLPSGLIGQLIGERMIRQHAPETEWSVELLRLRPTDRVLEVGCGAGRGLSRILAQTHQRHVIGMDLSPTMLRAAARRNRAAIASGQLQLVRGNLESPPFEGERFDKLFSIHTFYFWHDPWAVCAQLLDLLASGGRLVSTFATARREPDGAWHYWEVHQIAQALINALEPNPSITASLLYGPDSRAYNNVAIVVDKARVTA